jgi:hypothetical protein
MGVPISPVFGNKKLVPAEKLISFVLIPYG